jgi:hypothetical protein
MRKYSFIFIGVVLAAAIGLPWLTAYRSDQCIRYGYGLVGGRQIDCVAIDGEYFDRYFCLVFDNSVGGRVNYGHKQILLDGRSLQFPAGKNVGYLRPDGQIDFSTVTTYDITPNYSGSGEIYYILGKVPKLKHFTFGVPGIEFVVQRFQGLNRAL